MSSPLPQDLARFLQHLSRQGSREICGFIFGDPWEIVDIDNVAPGDGDFEMHHGQTQEQYMRWDAGRMVGVYHSHPGGTNFPSDNDIRHAPWGLRYWVVTDTAVTEWTFDDKPTGKRSAHLVDAVPHVPAGQGQAVDCGAGTGR